MSKTMTQPCETCWAVAWEPIQCEEDCEFADHPHEGPHIRCGLCWLSRRHGDVLREREADRAAINDYVEQARRICPTFDAKASASTRWSQAFAILEAKHAAAIQRAQDAKG